MENWTHPHLDDGNIAAFSFASLTSANWQTTCSIHKILIAIFDEKASLESIHHRNFIRHQAGDLAATKSPVGSPRSNDMSDASTPEFELLTDEPELFETVPCYVLSVGSGIFTSKETGYYYFGTGDSERFPGSGGVDLLLPPASFEDSLCVSLADDFIYPRHGYFSFDPTYGGLWLCARHGGIRVDDRPLKRYAKVLLAERCRISIGPYKFIFEFKVGAERETAFQHAKSLWLARYTGAVAPFESTSATPSSNDVRIGDWRLHGVVGSTEASTIYAATNQSSGKVVAVKRLHVDTEARSSEAEDDNYDETLEDISGHQYAMFVMQKYARLENINAVPIREAYLLWTPLARGDFSELAPAGRGRYVSSEVRKVLFVQALLGLSALHESGWIHRDIKPENLGVVECAKWPYAIIMDEAQARQAEEGYKPEPVGENPEWFGYGSPGYKAPEIENTAVDSYYRRSADIWSMGAVGYFLLVNSKLPWMSDRNMFLDAGKPLRNPFLERFRTEQARLLQWPPYTMEHLIALMLTEDPRKRVKLAAVLGHPAVQAIKAQIDVTIEKNEITGQKRSRT